jgi:bifunctional UDP-N-acetylglucosamine pyrophosphorylase/glucosamine-1-phosphate N-acetyltransferase
VKNAAIIMAAGLGTRMKSKKSKVLHEVCGKPMLQCVVDALEPLKLDRIVVVLGSPPGPEFRRIRGRVTWVVQKQKKGTGHAVMQAEKVLSKFQGNVLILSGDVPLITTATLKKLLAVHQKEYATATILTAVVNEPRGYGRVLRQQQQVVRIVEELDADDHTKKIDEINTGTYCFRNRDLQEALKNIRLNPIKKEYYLTDVFAFLNSRSAKIIPLVGDDPAETMGVNKRYELEKANKIMQRRIQRRLMDEGVTILDGDNTYIDAEVSIGQDTVIYPFSLVYKHSRIGSDCVIGPGARIVNSVLRNGVRVHDSCVTDSTLESGVVVGPFAHIREGTVLKDGSHVGNFVEIARSRIGEGSRAYHLSYIGDTEMGRSVNLGAGIITANWDIRKKKKFRTRIGDRASIGSNTVLIAPADIPAATVVPSHSVVSGTSVRSRTK